MNLNKVLDSRRRANEIVHFKNGLRFVEPARRHAYEVYSVSLLIEHLHMASDPLVRPQPWLDDKDTAGIQMTSHRINSTR